MKTTPRYFLSHKKGVSKKYWKDCTIAHVIKSRTLGKFAFIVLGNKKWSNPSGHFVYMRVYDALVGENYFLPWDYQTIRISCSCPQHQYGGPAYYSLVDDYFLRREFTDYRKPTRPQNNSRACKHELKVCDYLCNDVDTVMDLFRNTHYLNRRKLPMVKSMLKKELVSSRGMSKKKADQIASQLTIYNLDEILEKYLFMEV